MTDATNLEFARLDSLKREAYGRSVLPTGWVPTLTLGTIIMDKDQPERLFACIQPVCDAVRVPERRRFPLVPLNIITDKQKPFSARTETEGRHANLRGGGPSPLQYRTGNLQSGHTIENGPRHERMTETGTSFETPEDRVYEWLADLKGFFAMRLIQRSAGQWTVLG